MQGRGGQGRQGREGEGRQPGRCKRANGCILYAAVDFNFVFVFVFVFIFVYLQKGVYYTLLSTVDLSPSLLKLCTYSLFTSPHFLTHVRELNYFLF